MKVLLVLVAAGCLALAHGSNINLDSREIVQRSALSTIENFLHRAMNVAGRGCKAITNYVTGPICTAMSIVPAGSEVALCGFTLEFYEICLGTFEGTRAYCDTLGSGGVPGGTSLDTYVCNAIRRHGK